MLLADRREGVDVGLDGLCHVITRFVAVRVYDRRARIQALDRLVSEFGRRLRHGGVDLLRGRAVDRDLKDHRCVFLLKGELLRIPDVAGPANTRLAASVAPTPANVPKNFLLFISISSL